MTSWERDCENAATAKDTKDYQELHVIPSSHPKTSTIRTRKNSIIPSTSMCEKVSNQNKEKSEMSVFCSQALNEKDEVQTQVSFRRK
jgi:microcompartment protein CcmL/EutN